MKTKNVSLIIFVTLLFFIVSCSKSAIKDMDNEPNNKVTEAVPLVLDTISFITHIQENGDFDWFKIEIPEKGYYKLSAPKIPEGLKIQIKFAKYNTEESNKEKNISDWLDLPAIYHFSEKGTYFYVLHDDFDDASSEEDIVLKPKFIPEFDDYEMNDDINTAKELNFDQNYVFYLYPASDFDWFKMKLNGKKGYLKTSIDKTYEGVNLQVKFAKKNPDENNYITIKDWHEFPVSLALPETDEIYLSIHDDFEDAYSENPYTLKLQYLPEMDSNEPNNDFKSAKNVSAGDTLELAIYPKDDFDWFKLSVAKGDSLKFIVHDVAEPVHPQIRIYTYNEDENNLKTFRDWQDFPFATTMTDTSYYFSIHDDFEDARSEKTFKLIIKKVE
jgi:hypothetical protein